MFGQCAIVEILKEYRQLNEMKVMGDMDTSALTPDQKRGVLR